MNSFLPNAVIRRLYHGKVVGPWCSDNKFIPLKKMIMAIRNVWIEDGCTACELCVDICPEVFEMSTDTAMVIEEVNFDDHSENIREAADGCPVEVIRFEE